ncbi:hypothetical protein ACF1G0_01875 [Streptomyces sp. NPDC013953]|uniref:hypothetical protein n=1 Tax=Streptomyces sp. NPDC013953 TaxID=3364868 RepID=UPI0036FBEC3A
MLGAGAAVADSYGDEDGKDGNVVICDQQAAVSNDTYQIGLINLGGPLLGSGPATSTAIQQICSGENTVAGNEADAEAEVEDSSLAFGLSL